MYDFRLFLPGIGCYWYGKSLEERPERKEVAECAIFVRFCIGIPATHRATVLVRPTSRSPHLAVIYAPESTLGRLVQSRSAALRGPWSPAPVAPGPHLQTLLGVLRTAFAPGGYERQLVRTR